MKFGISAEQQGTSDALELTDSDLEAVHGGDGHGHGHDHGHGGFFGDIDDLFGSPFGYGAPAYYAPPAPAYYIPAPQPAPAYYIPAPAYYAAPVPYGVPGPCGY